MCGLWDSRVLWFGLSDEVGYADCVLSSQKLTSSDRLSGTGAKEDIRRGAGGDVTSEIKEKSPYV